MSDLDYPEWVKLPFSFWLDEELKSYLREVGVLC